MPVPYFCSKGAGQLCRNGLYFLPRSQPVRNGDSDSMKIFRFAVFARSIQHPFLRQTHLAFVSQYACCFSLQSKTTAEDKTKAAEHATAKAAQLEKLNADFEKQLEAYRQRMVKNAAFWKRGKVKRQLADEAAARKKQQQAAANAGAGTGASAAKQPAAANAGSAAPAPAKPAAAPATAAAPAAKK